MVGGGWVKSYLRTRIARLVPLMRRLTHLSPVSLFPLHLSSIDTYLSSPENLSSQVPRSPLAGVSPFFLWNNAHSGKVLYFLSFLSFSFICLSFVFHLLSFSFFHFLSFSFIFLHFPSFSFIFLHFPSFSFIFFVGCSKSVFLGLNFVTISLDSS